jgi:hypothetical protein
MGGRTQLAGLVVVKKTKTQANGATGQGQARNPGKCGGRRVFQSVLEAS